MTPAVKDKEAPTDFEANGRIVPGVSEDVPVDKYHVVVTGHLASWQWEVYRNGEPLPVPLRDGNYKSQRTAAAAGRVSIREFLEALEREEKPNG
jgi:hypothetical protein